MPAVHQAKPTNRTQPPRPTPPIQLRNPAVQREIAAAALTDPQVLEAFGARGADLDGYLLSQGFAARGLLPAGSGANDGLQAPSCSNVASDGGPIVTDVSDLISEGTGRDPLVAMIDGVVASIEKVGQSISEAGAWLKAKLLPAEQPAEVKAKGTGAEKGEEGAAGLMAMVAKVAVVLVMIILFKRAARF